MDWFPNPGPVVMFEWRLKASHNFEFSGSVYYRFNFKINLESIYIECSFSLLN